MVGPVAAAPVPAIVTSSIAVPTVAMPVTMAVSAAHRDNAIVLHGPLEARCRFSPWQAP